jgi:diguanylate cyclase (GGDEF)-like protein/PAS domain S-box-containing protein
VLLTATMSGTPEENQGLDPLERSGRRRPQTPSAGSIGAALALLGCVALASTVVADRAIVIGLLAAGPSLVVHTARVRLVLGVAALAAILGLGLAALAGLWGSAQTGLYLAGLAAVTAISARAAWAMGSRMQRAERAEHRLQVVFDGVSSGMALVGLSGAHAGRLLQVNAGLTRLTGYDEHTLLEMPSAALFHADEPVDHAGLRAQLRSGELGAYEVTRRWRPADGRNLWVRLKVNPVRSAESIRADYAVCEAADVTAQQQTQADLRASEERFRLAFDNAPIGMMLVSLRPDRLGRILKANEEACRVFGHDEDTLVGENVVALTHPADLAAKQDLVNRMAAGEIATFRTEKRYVRRDGQMIWGYLSASVVQTGDGTPDYYVSQVENITDRKLAEQRLTQQALYDDLTGLPNRLLLRDHLSQAVSRTARSGRHTAVLFVDLDDFKTVNDSLGHEAGDRLLVEVAGRLRGCLRVSDTAARLGGDEFVLVCEDLESPQEATQVAARIKAALAEPLVIDGNRVHLSASIGIATQTGTARADELLRDSDGAMYLAKKRGKSRYELADPEIHVRAARRMSLEGELRTAIDAEQLRLHYQPTFELRSGRLAGVEALLRWQHPERGLLYPAAFLDVAEDRGLVDPVGMWVLRTACRQAYSWQQRYGGRAPQMWINISGGQLGQQHLSAQIDEVLTDTGLSPDLLGVELTERDLIGRAHSIEDDLLALPHLGVQLAIDDFGTGYGGFDYLRRFPIDEIKIDRSFISGLGCDDTDTAITASVIALSRTLKIKAVAEGVETNQQRQALCALGCDLAQGYLFQRPVPAAELEELLAGDVV